MKKRILAVLLAATMLLSLVPMTVFATGTAYTITNGTPESAKETNHGYIAIDKTSAAEDETVTLTVAPSAGYQLKAGSPKVNDGAVTITCKGIGKYEFTMPKAAVAVTAEFEQIVLPYLFDFESDFIAAGWTTIDADGDGYDWKTDTDALWDEKFGIDKGHCAISRSYENNVGGRNANNWLFSPAITVPAGGAIVSWYEKSQDPSYKDSYTVYVGETTDLSDMTVICATHEAAGGPDSETETIETWTQKTVELSAEDYAGKTVYIAFRHLSYDCYILKIDDFAVGAEAPAHTHTVTFDANGGSVTPTSAETGTDGKLAT
ncbi:MAG: choice-of-anchor J domain-containing protein, partial [Clostridia bacterium]|nr:choice-of-anchor J domain-containing protein [Clostridia bacterium]